MNVLSEKCADFSVDPVRCSIQFIDGSAFIAVALSSIAIESGNNMFVIEQDFLIDVLHQKLTRYFSISSELKLE
jgi:hypothetical protein